MPKTDSNISGLLACFSNSVSIGLQFGVPLEEFVKRKFYLRFKSSGEVVGNTAIVNATSISDYVFRELAITYLGRVDLAQTDIEESRDSRRNSDTPAKSLTNLSVHLAISVNAIDSIIEELLHQVPNGSDKNSSYTSGYKK
jgi:hypothetical protein